MRIKEITLGMKRTVRHSRYKSSEPSVSLTAIIEDSEDIIAAVDELTEDLFSHMSIMCTREIEEYKKLEAEKARRLEDAKNA